MRRRTSTDGLIQADSVFSGISTFGRLPYAQCLSPNSDAKYDIAFIGASRRLEPYFSSTRQSQQLTH